MHRRQDCLNTRRIVIEDNDTLRLIDHADRHAGAFGGLLEHGLGPVHEIVRVAGEGVVSAHSSSASEARGQRSSSPPGEQLKTWMPAAASGSTVVSRAARSLAKFAGRR